MLKKQLSNEIVTT